MAVHIFKLLHTLNCIQPNQKRPHVFFSMYVFLKHEGTLWQELLQCIRLLSKFARHNKMETCYEGFVVKIDILLIFQLVQISRANRNGCQNTQATPISLASSKVHRQPTISLAISKVFTCVECALFPSKGLITWWISARAEISLPPPGWNIVAITWSISAQAQNANFREKVYWGAKTQ